MENKISAFEKGDIAFSDLFESFNGWSAYAKWSDCGGLQTELKDKIISELLKQV